MFKPSLTLLAALATSTLPLPTAANDYPVGPGCFWRNDSGPTDLILRIPDTLYVESTQADGSLIGGQSYNLRATAASPSHWKCYNRDSDTPVINTLTVDALQPPAVLNATASGGGNRTLPPADKIRQTSVPGIGAAIDWGSRFSGGNADSFDANGPAMAPFVAQQRLRRAHDIGFIPNQFWVVHLVKTGPLEPGRYRLDPGQKQFSSRLSPFAGQISDLWEMGLSAEIVVTGCGTAPTPISPNPVDLGSHDLASFAQGSYTPAVPFTLNLTGCLKPPAGSVLGIYVQLDPAEGSAPLDPDSGLFSLGHGATAQNVGVQMLRADARTPMPLARKERMNTVADGDLALGFNARLAKLADPVKAGKVQAALKFTVTYE
ncbi:fimbrial protein [Pseudomonas sp. NPDC007930]|uniref:fimbrial protein n=1 Tax=Pseudomonas sp. NPDC007930 TaxID=3364417 RepID=UPI0036E80FC6